MLGLWMHDWGSYLVVGPHFGIDVSFACYSLLLVWISQATSHKEKIDILNTDLKVLQKMQETTRIGGSVLGFWFSRLVGRSS